MKLCRLIAIVGLTPVALRYAQELEVFQGQLDDIRAKKDDLRARVLSRRSALPLWWTE